MKKMDRRTFLTRLGVVAGFPLSVNLLTLVAGCGRTSSAGEARTNLIHPSTTPSAKTEAVDTIPKPPDRTKATLMAVGDIMMHGSNIKAGYVQKTKSYDFTPFFEYMEPVFLEADWVVGNLETPLAGQEAGFTGYPMFNAPKELAAALKWAGFTMVTTANNHALDRGSKGLLKTIENVKEAGLMQTGTFAGPEDRDTPRILKKGDLSLAMCAYTYGTNGIPIPKDKPYLINLIDYERMGRDIDLAKKAGADFVALSLHFGNEYHRQPSKQQKEAVAKAFEYGADIVLGHHPHVVQPYEIKNSEKGNQVVIYSMGNFLANQLRKYTYLGVVFKVTMEKDSTGSKSITVVEADPTRILRLVKDNRQTYRVLPMKNVLEAERDKNLPVNIYASMKQELAEMDRHLKSMLPAPPQAGLWVARA